MKTEYKVVIENSYTRWYKLGTDMIHREGGPAIEYTDGTKYWYLNGIQYSKEEYLKQSNKTSCDGKVVEIDGQKYKLQKV